MAGEGGGGVGVGVGLGLPQLAGLFAETESRASRTRRSIRSSLQQFVSGGGSAAETVYVGGRAVGTVAQVLSGAVPLLSEWLSRGPGVRIGEYASPTEFYRPPAPFGAVRPGFGPLPAQTPVQPPAQPPATTPPINPQAPSAPPTQAGVYVPGRSWADFLAWWLEQLGRLSPDVLNLARQFGVRFPFDPRAASARVLVIPPAPAPGGPPPSWPGPPVVVPIGGDQMASAVSSIPWGNVISGALQGLGAVAQQFIGPGAGYGGYMPGGAPIVPMIAPTAPAVAGSGPFRTTAAGRAVAQTWFMPNPVTGRLEFFRPAGRPLIFSRDLATVRMVERIGRRFAPRGSRRTSVRRRRRRLGG